MANKTYRYKFQPPVVLVDPETAAVVLPDAETNVQTVDYTVDEDMKSNLDARLGCCGWVFDQEIV